MLRTTLVLVAVVTVVSPALVDTNVVVLLVNNIRTDDLSCYNPNTPVATPNMDRLASEGVLLNHHTVPALSLTANRAAHLTGVLPQRYGLQESGRDARQILHTLSRAGLPNDTLTYADFVKKSGYRTMAAGGWELGWGCSSWQDACHSPLQHGFDSFYGVPLSVGPPEGDQTEPGLRVHMRALSAYLNVMANQTRYRAVYREIAETAWYQWLALAAAGHGHLHQGVRLTDELQRQLDYLLVSDDVIQHWPYSLQGLTLPILDRSLQFIQDSKRAGRPFLLQHTFLQVHQPPIAPPHRIHDSALNAYYDGVKELDWAVGRILEQLQQLDILDDTIVYFSADSNDLMDLSGEHGSTITDTRVPGIFLWKKLMPPHVMKRPTSVLDILPTIVDAIGSGKELHGIDLDGRSLFFELLTRGETSQKRQYNYRGQELHSVTLVFPPDDDSVYKIYISKECQLCQGTSLVFNLTADPFQVDPVPEDSEIFKRVAEDVRSRLFVTSSVPSQLADFWQLAPLPELYPWQQVALYRPGVNTSGANDLYTFLEADVVLAAEAESGSESELGSGSEPESAVNELDPAYLQLSSALSGDEVPLQ